MVTIKDEKTDIQKEIDKLSKIIATFHGSTYQRISKDTQYAVSSLLNLKRSQISHYAAVVRAPHEDAFYSAAYLFQPLLSVDKNISGIKAELSNLVAAINYGLSETEGIGRRDARIAQELNVLSRNVVRGITSSLIKIFNEEKRLVNQCANQVRHLHEALNKLKEKLQAEIDALDHTHSFLHTSADTIINLKNTYLPLLSIKHPFFVNSKLQNAINEMNNTYDKIVQELETKHAQNLEKLHLEWENELSAVEAAAQQLYASFVKLLELANKTSGI